MIGNIIDKRTNPFNAICDVSFHPSCELNSQPNATQFKVYRNNIVYRNKFSISLAEAISLANEIEYPVTLMLYDIDILATRALK